MPPLPAPAYDVAKLLKDLQEFQSSFFDKASTYTKIIIGIGYGGFFAAWSGTKQYLGPRLVVESALLMTVSLLLYVVFEICQTMIISYLAIDFARAVDVPGADVAKSLEAYSRRSSQLTRPLLSAWKIVFPISALTGLSAAIVLIYGFIRSLWHLW